MSEKIPPEPKNTICIDFDGVLAEYDGWKGEEHFGFPIAGAIDFVRDLVNAGYQVCIWTTRASREGGRRALQGWFTKHGMDETRISRLWFSDVKFPAILYIDDRAYRFDGIFPTLKEIDNLRPWWDKKA